VILLLYCGLLSNPQWLIAYGQMYYEYVSLNTIEENTIQVYPNPATSIVTISVTDVDSYNLSVTDLTGKIVMTKSLNGIQNTIDISNLATGAYFFNLSSGEKNEVVKILKN
jgi:hypothetical protein